MSKVQQVASVTRPAVGVARPATDVTPRQPTGLVVEQGRPKQRILHALREVAPSGLTSEEICERIRGGGPTYCNAYLRDLLDSGAVSVDRERTPYVWKFAER